MSLSEAAVIWVDHSPTSPFRDQIYATWHNTSNLWSAGGYGTMRKGASTLKTSRRPSVNSRVPAIY